MNNDLMNRAADNIRILSAAMVEKAKSGHPGGAMGGADFINVLYAEFLNYNPDEPLCPCRDRFFLDPGHMSPMLYSVLCLAGKYSIDDLKNFRQWGSKTPGHPERDLELGIENTSGPLGQGHTMAVGAAIAERFMVERFGSWMSHKTYTYISDGGIQEEVAAGAGRVAGHLGLSNLIMFYDANNVQLSTTVEEIDISDTAARYESWGWRVVTIDGNDPSQIRTALHNARKETEKPTLIIGKTIMAKGARGSEGKSYENAVSTHGQPLTAAGCDISETIKNLGGNVDDPFEIFPETCEVYEKSLARLRDWAKEYKAVRAAWAKENPELEAKLTRFLSGELPDLDFSKIEVPKDSATRAASSAVLSFLAENVENMIVASADLSNSDKTDGFLKKTKAITKSDFSGRFFQAGVSELTMACIMNGIAIHGGIIPACGTFFVFSDYMKPAIRLSALMRLPVIYVWSHDSFRVGEDGPTHQPVEHEMQIRLLEHLHNHEGERSMVVLRPGDGYETVEAWKYAMYNKRPTGLIFSRQNIKTLPGDRSKAAENTAKGAYILVDSEGTPDVVMIASGSEVSTLVEGAEMLQKDGIKVRIVSAPSEGLFRDQSEEYQNAVLPKGIKRFGLTSGLPLTLAALVGENGTIHGLDHFGYSAPFKVLDEKFGFSGENVYNEVKKLLGK